MTVRQYDAIILGGGLAGLGLACELKAAKPELDIVVLEKNHFPRPRAIAKVGESTVEIGSHYLAHRLDLADHLRQSHLKKFGIRMFFGEGGGDLAAQDELGASQTFGIPTFQIDRGDLENQLASRVQAAGVTLIQGADIQALDCGDAGNPGPMQRGGGVHAKKVTVADDSGTRHLLGRWLIDAAGRAALLKSHRYLAMPGPHRANAIWFRVDRRILVDDWSGSNDWQQRCQPAGRRWLSTNHLTGAGYWVWIIPLASGVTSVGIVMDDTAFHAAAIDSPTAALRWLAQHQPRCAEAVGNARFLDFVVLPDYSYDCRQLFSEQGWGIIGEAGVFADPFYSPGTDFIAFGNGFLRELMTAQLRGEDIRLRTAVYERLFRSIYDNTLSLYTGQYGGFGDRRMMGLKLLWDYTYYWGVLSFLYFRNLLVDVAGVRRLGPLLMRAQSLNQQVQNRFRQRAAQRMVLPAQGLFLDQYRIPCLRYFNRVLQQEPGGECDSQLQTNIRMAEQIAAAVMDMLEPCASTAISDAERDLLGDYRRLILA